MCGGSIIPPSLPDLGEGVVFFDNGIVAGAWLDALRFVHFQVSDYPGRECADALASPQSLSSHATGDTNV